MQDYIGRFAPSPTGPLHMGSLIAALASYLDARAHQGQWLLRMEDLDPPREEVGAAQAILQSLRDHGLHWDGDVLWQSQRHALYQQTIDSLLADAKAFYCTCSRSDLQALEGIHPGRCRAATTPPDQPHAIRLQVPDREISFTDLIQGPFSQQLRREVGDVVLRRKDGWYAYQLAVVVDDMAQGVTRIVRGSDLLDSTPRQCWLQQQLGNQQLPQYAHIPVLTNSEGQKLSKQTFAPGISSAAVLDNLVYALRFLRQPVPPPPRQLDDLLNFAIKHWDLGKVPRQLSIAG